MESPDLAAESILTMPSEVASCRLDDETRSFFEEILDDAKSIEEKVNRAKDEKERDRHRERLKQLVARNKDRLVKESDSSAQNFLHFLASVQARSSTAVRKLVARMLLQPGGIAMLLAVDVSQNTPLHTAIHSNSHNFLHAVSGHPSLPETIEKIRQSFVRAKEPWALQQTVTTFLHAALASRALRSNNELLLAIIALAPDDMLCASDSRGQIPLHVAVEHSKSTAMHFDVIQELVSRNSSILVKIDKDKKSVYQRYLDSTLTCHRGSMNSNLQSIARDSPHTGTSTPEASTPSRISTVTAGTPSNIDETSRRIRDLLLLESMRVMSCDVAHRCLRVPNEPDKELWFDYMPAPSTDMTFSEFASHWKLLNFETILKYVSIANINFKPEKGADPVTRGSRDDATQILSWLLNNRGVKRILHVIVDDMKPMYHSNELIAQTLEKANVEILDWRRPDLCPASIFSIGKNLQKIYLHWGGNNAILRAWSEADGLPRLARYGKLKAIIIVWPKDSPDLSSNTSEQKQSFDKRLRRNWLAATVQSSLEPGKSPEGKRPTPRQETPLGGLLQHRNKKEPQDANATLVIDESFERSLSSSQVSIKPEGIPKLGLSPEITHAPADSYAKPEFADNSSQTGGKDPHSWMQSMEDFTTAFLRVEQPSSQYINANSDFKPVQIALIDDGVDTTNRSLQKKTYYGRSFAFDTTRSRNFPYWMSDSNHGTTMARFIRKICPTADIYIIKVATKPGSQNSRKLTIDIPSAIEVSIAQIPHVRISIASISLMTNQKAFLQAINHAIDRGARIISMSWSVKPPSKGKIREDFDQAIQRAVNKDIIMLCAFSDKGKTGKDETYPYEANQANIIRIGAATAHGKNADYVDENQVDFLFPGHEIYLSDSAPDKELGDVNKGSSVATAIAAGLAAMVLECIRIGHFWTSKHGKNQSMDPITADDLKKMDSKAMKNAFEGMSHSQSRYIWIEQTFTRNICDRIKNGGRVDQCAIITSLASQFLRERR